MNAAGPSAAPTPPPSVTPVLEVEDLHVQLRRPGWRSAPVRALDGVTLRVRSGATVGLVGESGSGKSTLGRAILGLVQPTGGLIRLEGRDITRLPAERRQQEAGVLQVVFQDPYSSLNPSRTIGQTLTEPLEIHGRMGSTEARAKVAELLEAVRLPSDTAERYPHAFSGGQRQRIAVARALSTTPRVVICDEAMSALDLVTQAQVIGMFNRLQREYGMAYLQIGHNLPVITHIAQHTVVLYRGRVMEQGPARDVHDDPQHPYTVALLAAVPSIDPHRQAQRRSARRAAVVPLADRPPQTPGQDACPFAGRCPLTAQVCWTARPRDVAVGTRTVACHAHDPDSGHPEA